MKSKTGQQILSNISRSKGNQGMKFGQLIAYNMRHIFLENYAGEASPIHFCKKIKIKSIC